MAAKAEGAEEVKPRGVTVHYREASGGLMNAGKIVSPKEGSIPARTLNTIFHGVPVKLTWRYDNITSMLASDRESAEKLVGMFGLN
jgi:hypothetical protein